MPLHPKEGDAGGGKPLQAGAEGKKIRIGDIPLSQAGMAAPVFQLTIDSLHTVIVPPEQEQGVRRAVEQAVQMGIVHEEVHPALTSTPRKGYLLSSSHYGTYEYDPITTPGDKKQTQVELFQLMHLLAQQGYTGPVFVEGRDNTQTYSPFRGTRPKVTLAGTTYDIHDPVVQQALFENPAQLISIMDQQQRLAGQTGGSTPIFYQYSAHKNFRGAHTPATEILVRQFGEWVKWGHSFEKKYAFFFGAFTATDGTVHVTIESGWNDQGTPLLLLGTRWMPASEFIQDAETYLRYADALHAVDIARETELADFMSMTAQGEVPLAFAGKAHEFAIAQHAVRHMNLHVLTPKSSMHLNHLRRRHPVNDARSTILRIDIMQKILAFARGIAPQKS